MESSQSISKTFHPLPHPHLPGEGGEILNMAEGMVVAIPGEGEKRFPWLLCFSHN